MPLPLQIRQAPGPGPTKKGRCRIHLAGVSGGLLQRVTEGPPALAAPHQKIHQSPGYRVQLLTVVAVPCLGRTAEEEALAGQDDVGRPVADGDQGGDHLRPRGRLGPDTGARTGMRAMEGKRSPRSFKGRGRR